MHEACHAVVAFRTRQHMEIDIATIEKGSDYLGMVASIPPEDQFTRWRSEYESDILVSLASLAGERMFFDGDSSSGVSGDLESATAVASFMEGYWGMGHTVSSYSTARRLEVGSPGGGRGGPQKGESTEKVLRAALADRIEDQLAELLSKAEEILEENRLGVLALAHALETHKTLSGDDVEAVLEQRIGISVDGTVYSDPDFIAQLEAYHEAAAGAHVGHTRIDGTMPEGGRLEPPPVPEIPGARRRRPLRGLWLRPATGLRRARPATAKASRVRGRGHRATATRRPRATVRGTAARRVTRRPFRAGVGPRTPTPMRPPRSTARTNPAPTRRRRSTARPSPATRTAATAPPRPTTARPRPPRGIRRSRCTGSRTPVRSGGGRAAGRHAARGRAAGRPGPRRFAARREPHDGPPGLPDEGQPQDRPEVPGSQPRGHANGQAERGMATEPPPSDDDRPGPSKE